MMTLAQYNRADEANNLWEDFTDEARDGVRSAFRQYNLSQHDRDTLIIRAHRIANAEVYNLVQLNNVADALFTMMENGEVQ